jgi:hypothetical protein
MSNKSSHDDVFVNVPTNATYASSAFSARFRSSGWFELFVPHTGDAVGTILVAGGNSRDVATHNGLDFSSAQIYINGEDLSGTPFTGITYTAAGTLSIAAAQVADAHIRIPVINVPLFYSATYTRSSGGSATQYLQLNYFGRQAT